MSELNGRGLVGNMLGLGLFWPAARRLRRLETQYDRGSLSRRAAADYKGERKRTSM